MRVYRRPRNEHTTLVYLTEAEKRELLSRDESRVRMQIEKMVILITAREVVG